MPGRQKDSVEGEQLVIGWLAASFSSSRSDMPQSRSGYCQHEDGGEQHFEALGRSLRLPLLNCWGNRGTRIQGGDMTAGSLWLREWDTDRCHWCTIRFVP